MAGPLLVRRARLQPRGLPEPGWRSTLAVSSRTGRVHLTVESEPVSPTTPVERYAETIKERARALPGYRLLEGVGEEWEGRAVRVHRFEWALPNGPLLRQLQVTSVEDGHGLTVSATAPAELADQLEPQLRALIEMATERATGRPGGTPDLWQKPHEAWSEVRSWF